MLIEEKNMTITHHRRRVVSKGWSAKRLPAVVTVESADGGGRRVTTDGAARGSL